MSQGWRPVDGDEITPTAAPAPAEDDVHTAETSAAPVAPAVTTADDDEVALRTRAPRPQADWRSIAIGAILVLVALQVVIGFLVLGSINQVRDQSAAANGLQKCIYNAQVNATSASSEGAAFKACLAK